MVKHDLKPLLACVRGKERYQRLISGPPDTTGIKSGCVVLQPGESVGEHVTEGKEEVIIVLKGQGCVICKDESPMNVEAGGVVYIPPETSHDVKNTGRDILQYIFVVSPVQQKPRGYV